MPFSTAESRSRLWRTLETPDIWKHPGRWQLLAGTLCGVETLLATSGLGLHCVEKMTNIFIVSWLKANRTKTTPTLPLEPLDITQLLYNSECILPFPPEAGNVVSQLYGIWANEKRNDRQVDLSLFRISNIHPSEATHIPHLSPSPRTTARWLRTNKSEFNGWGSLEPHYGWKRGWPCCSVFRFFWYFELCPSGEHIVST